MKTLKTLLAGGIIILGSAVASEAQIRTGTKEVAFAGNFADSDSQVWAATGYFGYFYSSNLQILGIADVQGGSSRSETGSIGPGLDWHFTTDATTQDFLPFVGVSYLFGIGSGVDDSLGAHVGLKQFLQGNIAIRYQVGYGVDPGNTSDSTFRASVGLSYFF